MKLSEAIREGAKLRPQGFGGIYRTKDRKNCSCVAEAALEAATGKLPHLNTLTHKRKQFRDLFGVDIEARIPSPIYDRLPQSIGIILLDLNDTQKWTREQIADWLEGQGY